MNQVKVDGWDGPVHPAANVFPLMDGDEFDDLVASVEKNGLREPVWLDRDGALLDGRNRIRACQRAGIRPTFRQYEGDDPVSFVVDLNLSRRHLTATQKAVVALDLVPLYELQTRIGRPPKPEPTADMFQVVASESGAPVHPFPSAPKGKATARAAKQVGVSGRTVASVKAVAEKAPDLLPKMKSGELPAKRAERIVRDREAEAKRIEAAKVARESAPERPRVDIRHGDFREALADLSDVDAIITDPPYPAEFLPLLDDLAAWADKVLKPDGVLAVLFGQTNLPEVYRRLDGHRPYRWTMAYMTAGQGYVSHPRRIQSNWKPVLVYGGGPRLADVVRSEGTDAGAKDLHHWGQDYGAFHTIVERLTLSGQTVVDPFMGAGTTLLAANALGRHAIGCDVDLAHVETTRRRLA